jgi:radical SAM superfamily enzyme YgiQ (UPF0313 family)
MAGLGYQLVAGMLAAHGAFRTERYFAAYEGRPAPAAPPPVGLEYGTPLGEQQLIAVAAYYEPDYLNILRMLGAAGVRLWTAERGEFEPLVFLGGPAATANAEPMAPFADAVFLGDAEESLPRALDIVAARWGARRRELWEALAAVPGIYVPALYRVILGRPGGERHVADADGRPWPGPAWLPDLTPYRGASWWATPYAEFGKLMLVEPIRGCGRGCHFCETPLISPPRRRDLASLAALLDEAAAAGVRKVGLVGAALADYDGIVSLIEDILARGMTFSVSSLALGAPATRAIIAALGKAGHRSVTLAPEGATPAARRRWGKAAAEGALEGALAAAAAAGLSRVKLYYLVGGEGETDEDVAAIGRELAALTRRFRRLNVEARVNALVPKPGTRCAAVPLLPRPEYRRRLKLIRREAGRAAVVAGSWREAAFQARVGAGDRGAARWLERAAANGA